MQLHDHSLTSSFLHTCTHMADPYLNRAPQSGRLTSQQWKESEWPIKLAGKTRGKFVTCCVIWISSLRNSGSSSYPPPLFPMSKKRKERRKERKKAWQPVCERLKWWISRGYVATIITLMFLDLPQVPVELNFQALTSEAIFSHVKTSCLKEHFLPIQK